MRESTSNIPGENVARHVVDDGVSRYIASRHGRVDSFVDANFALAGSLRLHREALGWDIARAPWNLSVAAPQAGLHLAAASARKLGIPRVAQRLANTRLLLRTDVGRTLVWRLHADFLELPFQDGNRITTRDALAETILEDARVTATLAPWLAAIAERAGEAEWRETLSRAMTDYAATRAAASEVTTALLSLGGGVVALNKLTPGALSLGPAVASVLAQQAAVSSFPLGAGLGSIWYGLFPATPSAALVAGLTGGLLAAAVVTASFAGVVADPVQRRLGLHQRRLHRLLDGLERQLTDPSARGFVAHDHYVARLLDLFDLIGAAYRIAVH